MKTSPSAKMPTEILEEEHHFIQKVIGAMAVLAERLEQAETVDAKKLQRVMDFIRTFAENGPWICPQSIRHFKRRCFRGSSGMEESLKIVVCYGDSNTWGFNPATQDRYPTEERWTGVLAEELAAPYRVIEEGLNGRTTVWDDPIEEWRNGKSYLLPCLWSHMPIDLVTIMLGTNDLKERFSVSAYDIAAAVGVLVDITQRSAAGPKGNAPQVLLIAPPVVGKLTDYAEMFEDAVAKSKKFAEHYRRVAQKYRCHFLDTAPIITSSDLDGIHLDGDEHRKLGLAVARHVREILD